MWSKSYPYIEYIKYLLAGSTAMGIFIMAMIGGGITYIDDKLRGLHEGYLMTPITKMELIGGLIGAGTLKAFMAGMCLAIIGGLIAGIERIWDPVRLFYLVIVVLVASVAMISLMFLVMVRVDDPLVPRAIFGVLNMLLFFPSGAMYPTRLFLLAPLDFGHRPVHLHGARAAQSYGEEYGIRGDLYGRADSGRLLGYYGFELRVAVQATSLGWWAAGWCLN